MPECSGLVVDPNRILCFGFRASRGPGFRLHSIVHLQQNALDTQLILTARYVPLPAYNTRQNLPESRVCENITQATTELDVLRATAAIQHDAADRSPISITGDAIRLRKLHTHFPVWF